VKSDTGNTSRRIHFLKRISVRVTIIILVILSFGIGVTIYYYLESQNTTIIESRENAIMGESTVLYIAVKNNMLAGEAPIAVELFRDFRRTEDVADIKLFRDDGVIAFSDNATLEVVNRNLGGEVFMPKTQFIPREVIDDKHFQKAVSSIDDIFVRDVAGRDKTLIIYKPLLNQPKCSRCHGLDHVIRGVIRISSSVNEVYERTQMNITLSAIIYSAVVFLLSLAIILFIRRVIITRIFKIGTVVEGVGSGDFKTKIAIQEQDELATLAHQINDMIDGLHERFKLTKFVSRSTLEHVKGDDDISLGGEKKVMTVLFSDIRGFTSFSEKRDPGAVMKILNEVMNLQSQVISEYGGDIDKFVGDEIMAVFEGDDMVLRAIQAAEEINRILKEYARTTEDAVFVGVGINTGEMISGNMGSGDRMDRTVIGDAVNLGARLCSIAGKNTIVISEYSYAYVRDKVAVTEHDPIAVKGKAEPVKIYTVRKTQ
jgi:adenylate cyclase